MDGLLGLPHWAVVILQRTEAIMASVEDLNAKVTELQGTIASLGSDLGSALERVQADVDFLKAKIAEGADVSTAVAKLDESIASLGTLSERLRSVDPVPENPTA